MEGEAVVVTVQTIFVCQLWTAASGTDTDLAVIDTEYGVSGFLQFIVVSLCCQLFGCIFGEVEADRCLIVNGQFLVGICCAHIIAVIVASVLLRTDIVFVHIANIC